MTYEKIAAELNTLPEEMRVQVFNYIRFLKSSYGEARPLRKPKFGFGKYRVEMSEDFDAPLEDFKEYM
ncbi:MAG: DUF2281 domain-containing protein [Bacteroidia bacterium]|nr:DUF2281 domain-containing protein [Bacteroidia bacterium]